MSRTKTDWEQNVRREVPGAVILNNAVAAECIRLDCTSRVEIGYSGSRMPPVAIRGRIINKGWTIGKKGPVCPDCGSRKTPAEEPKVITTTAEQDTMNQNPETPFEAPPSAAQSQDARKVHRAVMGWLEEAYDEERKQYRKGFSDQSIATETGAAVSYVSKCRDDYFGVLGMPVEIEVLTADIARMEREAREFIEATQKRLAEAANEFAATRTAITDRIESVRSRLGKLIKDNGWS